jgi:hypothetical protein
MMPIHEMSWVGRYIEREHHHYLVKTAVIDRFRGGRPTFHAAAVLKR